MTSLIIGLTTGCTGVFGLVETTTSRSGMPSSSSANGSGNKCIDCKGEGTVGDDMMPSMESSISICLLYWLLAQRLKPGMPDDAAGRGVNGLSIYCDSCPSSLIIAGSMGTAAKGEGGDRRAGSSDGNVNCADIDTNVGDGAEICGRGQDGKH